MSQTNFHNLNTIIQQLICPLTHDFMKDPVTIQSGHTYDRQFIQTWFNLGHTTNPLTGLPLKSFILYPNISMRNIMQKMVKFQQQIRKEQNRIYEMQKLLEGWQKQIYDLKFQSEYRGSERCQQFHSKYCQKKQQFIAKISKLLQKHKIYNWVTDTQSKGFNDITLRGNTMTATKYFTWIFSKNKLIGKNQLTVKFTNIGKYGVTLGISDIKNKYENYQNWNDNCVRYDNFGNCYIVDSLKSNSNGYKVGEEVTMMVDINLGLIKWIVGDQVRHQVHHKMFQDKKISWVPYIYFDGKDDSIEIME